MAKAEKSSFVYVTYIRTTPRKLWAALTSTDFIPRYWMGVRAEVEWKKGGAWKLVFPDGTVADTGKIMTFEPPHRLAIRWQHEYRPELKKEGSSLCTMEIEPAGRAVKLTLTHTIARKPSKFIQAVSNGWPAILSNLKSLLETGKPAAPRRL